MAAKPKVILLGNCVAQRLQNYLARFPAFLEYFQLAPAPMIHVLTKAEQWRDLAALALGCDIIFSQPLFSFGPCNTQALRETLTDGQRLVLFASPNFEPYFPDAVVLKIRGERKFEPILDWHSSIIFSCFLQGLSVFEVPDVYLNHPMFRAESMKLQLARGLENYAARERGLDLSTCVYALRNYAGRKLFHTPKHPADELLDKMLTDMLACLGLGKRPEDSSVESFSFNQWPIITRHHNLFAFAEQDYFVIAGQKFSLEDAAMAYYNFYEFHPHVVEANSALAIALD